MSTSKMHIVVIGAGVIGLQTAVSLLEAGYDVTIVAKHFPGDRSIEYTSPWAGAQWRTHAGPEDEQQKSWDVASYRKWYNIVQEERRNPDVVESGLGIYNSEFYSLDSSIPWFAKDVESFQMIAAKKNVGGKDLTGHTYQSIMINVPMYLNHLHLTAVKLGATCHKTYLPISSTIAGTLRSATETIKLEVRATPVDAFVNATGISALKLVPDSAIYPVRGQTLTVRGEAKGITTVDFSPDNPTPESPNVTYVLPRPHSGTTILGGTKQAGNWSAEPNPETTKEILEGAKQFAPELLNEKGEFDVVSAQVGLRPGRKGGARVEIEEVKQPGQLGEKMVVCHAYGHSGAGFQNSIGSAEKVVRLFEDYFKGQESGKARL